MTSRRVDDIETLRALALVAAAMHHTFCDFDFIALWRFLNSCSFWLCTRTATVLVLLLGELNYRFVETPLRERGSAIARRYAEQSATARGTQTG